MQPRKPSRTTTRLLAAAGLTAAIAGVAAAPVLAQDDAGTSSSQPTAEASPSPEHQRPTAEEREARRTEISAALAAQLGISVDELTAARETAHDAVVAQLGEVTRPERNPDATTEEREAAREAMQAQRTERKAAFDQAMADALGISVDDLTAARQEVAIDRVEAKVAAGELTQEQADAIIERIRSGEAPEGGRGGIRERLRDRLGD